MDEEDCGVGVGFFWCVVCWGLECGIVGFVGLCDLYYVVLIDGGGCVVLCMKCFVWYYCELYELCWEQLIGECCCDYEDDQDGDGVEEFVG